MDSFINRNYLRNELLEFASCYGNPTYLSRARAIEVVDKIPEGIVRCRNCKRMQECKLAQRLGPDGYCSEGERA